MYKKHFVICCFLIITIMTNGIVAAGSKQKASPTSNSSNNYLIILDNDLLKEAVKDFVNYKTNEGYKVKLLCSNEINFKGSDNAEKLRNYLIDQETKNNLEYVLLIGDPFVAEKANPQETGGNIPMKYLYDFSEIHKVAYNSDFTVANSDKTLSETGNIPSDLLVP